MFRIFRAPRPARWLRIGGAAAAGIVGGGIASAVKAGPADAQDLLVGQDNDAGVDGTALQSRNKGATLSVNNDVGGAIRGWAGDQADAGIYGSGGRGAADGVLGIGGAELGAGLHGVGAGGPVPERVDPSNIHHVHPPQVPRPGGPGVIGAGGLGAAGVQGFGGGPAPHAANGGPGVVGVGGVGAYGVEGVGGGGDVGWGVFGQAAHNAVVGQTTSSAAGHPAAGVLGITDSKDPYSGGVVGLNNGVGFGVIGFCGHGSPSAAVFGSDDAPTLSFLPLAGTPGVGPGVLGLITNLKNTSPAVIGENKGAGVGGQFAINPTNEHGKPLPITDNMAQLELVPASDTPPEFGRPGQLFVDVNEDLWFYKSLTRPDGGWNKVQFGP